VIYLMSRLQSLHNKTQVVEDGELPYNPRNVLLQASDLQAFFAAHGLAGLPHRNLDLYRNAFVHRSYCTMKNANVESGNERCPPDCLPLQDVSYERLEYLGDSVLGMVVARYMYERFPDRQEGFLSNMRTKIVNGRMLGSLAERMGFPKFAIMSRQIEESQGRSNYKIMEDIFEAFIGALIQDFQTDADVVALPPSIAKCMPYGPASGAGFFVAEQWIIAIMEKYVDFAEIICARTNYKDMLVRHMQHAFQDSPRFLEVNVDKKTNHKEFTYCVRDRNGANLGTANGASKKDAENAAALKALHHYGVVIAVATA
jgi:ribonuclease-3